VLARAGDRFVIRSYSPVTTIGGGTIAEPAAGKRRSLTPAGRALLEAIIDGDAAASIPAAVRIAGWAGVPVSSLPVATAATPAEVAAVLEGGHAALYRAGERVFAAELVHAGRELLVAATDRHHQVEPLRPGIDREELRRALPAHAHPPLTEAILAGLLGEGTLVARGGTVAAAEFQPQLAPEQQALRQRLDELFQTSGLTPPAVAELPQELRSRADLWPILKILEQDGVLIPLAPDLFIARAALEDAIGRARSALADREALSPADFRDALAISRKYLIPLLEYFDRHGVTRRRGDERVLMAAEGPART
jgi:selenocysteine-specific elongation factor